MEQPVTKPPGRQVLCLQLSFSRVLRTVWVGASWRMIHRCLAANSCHGADAVRARCNYTLSAIVSYVPW